MGNFTSYFNSKEAMEEYIGQIAGGKEIDNGSHLTPARCNKTSPGMLFDPRSPTYNIDRTPIVVVTDVEIEGPDDPRSPSCEIIRTPVYPIFLQMDKNPADIKEREELKQVLNFTDLDSLSLSNIEEDQAVNNEDCDLVNTEEPVLIPAEETIDFSSLVIAASSTPAPSPVKPTNKIKRPICSNVVDENSFSKSPLNGGNTLLVRPRVPFGEVNRPALASPRLHLQNKQRHIVRSEILQHQQRFGNKSD